ncbi:hypothetical protein [Cryptosporangium sp. NPDC051539]|uniref:hypothetical protein n=1 Tax=Cryptosporangium sp. NPDC051539 TaxID=3363962 RepID=UPI0037B06762
MLSIWRQGECRATFRLAGTEVADFVRALLEAAPPSAPGTGLPAVVGEALAPPVVQVQLSGSVVVELNTVNADAMQQTTVGGIATAPVEARSAPADESPTTPVKPEPVQFRSAETLPVATESADAAETSDVPSTGSHDPSVGRPGPEPVV